VSSQARLPLYYEHGSGRDYVCITADKALFGGIYYELADLSDVYLKQVAMPEAMGCLYGA
jgi:hypothetical protein